MHRTDNLATYMCLLSRNSGNLNLLEAKQSVQALRGVTLP